jgi:hypothetical protein
MKTAELMEMKVERIDSVGPSWALICVFARPLKYYRLVAGLITMAVDQKMDSARNELQTLLALSKQVRRGSLHSRTFPGSSGSPYPEDVPEHSVAKYGRGCHDCRSSLMVPT